MRRTIKIEGSSLKLDFSPALVIDRGYIFVSVCHLYEPKYNVDIGSNTVVWYNPNGVVDSKEKLYTGLYGTDRIENIIDSISGVKLDWESSEHTYLQNKKSGKTMKIPGLDVMFGYEKGEIFPYNKWVRSGKRHNLFGSKWMYISCDAVDTGYNEPDGTIAEFPNCPIFGVQRFEINSYTRLREGVYQSITFRVLGDDRLPIDVGKIMLEFYIRPHDSLGTQTRLLHPQP